MNSYQLYKKMILISGGSKQRQQTNKRLERAIEMQEWNDFSNQMKPTETCYSYKVRMKFYFSK